MFFCYISHRNMLLKWTFRLKCCSIFEQFRNYINRLNCFEFLRISLKLVGTDDEAKVFCFSEQVLKLDSIDFDS